MWEKGEDTHGGDEMDDEARQGRLARGPVGRPELAAEREGYALLRELLVHARCRERLCTPRAKIPMSASCPFAQTQEKTYNSDDVPERTQRDEHCQRLLRLRPKDVPEEETRDGHAGRADLGLGRGSKV